MALDFSSPPSVAEMDGPRDQIADFSERQCAMLHVETATLATATETLRSDLQKGLIAADARITEDRSVIAEVAIAKEG